MNTLDPLYKKLDELEALTPVPGSETLHLWLYTTLQELISVLTDVTKPAPTTSKYGVPAGTPEYWRRYFADPVNREKARARSRDAARRRREQLAQAKREADALTVEELKASILLPDGRRGTDDDRVFNAITSRAQQYESEGLNEQEALGRAQRDVLGVELTDLDEKI